LATSNQEKGTVVNHYYVFDRSEKKVYVPSHHQEMVAEIYEWLELPRRFDSGDPTPAQGPSDISVFPLPEENNGPGSKQGYIFEGGVEARHPPGRAVLRRGFFCRGLGTGQSYPKMPIIEPGQITRHLLSLTG